MSETMIVAIVGALLGVIELLTTAILGWIAFEIRRMREALEEKVDRGDCARDMCRHASEIKDLWGETRCNAEKIARLEK